uniref:Reelin domain-containing protein n=1 Tax=Clastoptera arizonana TaxID=38151 RepID=A0A1B6E9Q5_9HEMI
MLATLILLLSSVCILHQATGYSEGAPDNACLSLRPEHLKSEQKEGFPYEIILGTKQLECSDSPPIINFTLKGLKGEVFKGFMIQARMGTKTVGTFEPEPIDYMMMDCPGDRELVDEEGLEVWCDKIVHTEPGKNTATHYKAEKRNSMTFYWKPPANTTGDIYFHYTVVKDFDTFWVNQQSEPLTILESRKR